MCWEVYILLMTGSARMSNLFARQLACVKLLHQSLGIINIRFNADSAV